VTPAVYHLDEYELWICFGQMEGARPDGFATRGLPGRTLYKCQRPKPPGKEALKDMKKLAGTWVATAVEFSGKPCPEYTMKKLTYVISDTTITDSWNGGKGTFKY